jgi:hypothetical protein
MICHSHDSGGLTTGAGGQFAMIGSTAMLRSSIRTARRPVEPKSRSPVGLLPTGHGRRRAAVLRADGRAAAHVAHPVHTRIATSCWSTLRARRAVNRARTDRRSVAVASMLSVHISSPTCAQRSRGRMRATSAMNSRRCSAVLAQCEVATTVTMTVAHRAESLSHLLCPATLAHEVLTATIIRHRNYEIEY